MKITISRTPYFTLSWTCQKQLLCLVYNFGIVNKFIIIILKPIKNTIIKMRRRAGVGAIHKQKLHAEKYKDKGNELSEVQFETMSRQMEVFKENLEEFAAKHKSEIKKNPEFRRKFQEMCAAIGVDPLSSGKGFWSVLGIGDFYYELSVQVIEACLAANHKTGKNMYLLASIAFDYIQFNLLYNQNVHTFEHCCAQSR